VQFLSRRRWFLAADLVRTIPDKALRFFRSEVMNRWTDLLPDDVVTLNGHREELIAFLQERYGFGLRRAAVETMTLFLTLRSGFGPRSNFLKTQYDSEGFPIALTISA